MRTLLGGHEAGTTPSEARNSEGVHIARMGGLVEHGQSLLPGSDARMCTRGNAAAWLVAAAADAVRAVRSRRSWHGVAPHEGERRAGSRASKTVTKRSMLWTGANGRARADVSSPPRDVRDVRDAPSDGCALLETVSRRVRPHAARRRDAPRHGPRRTGRAAGSRARSAASCGPNCGRSLSLRAVAFGRLQASTPSAGPMAPRTHALTFSGPTRTRLRARSPLPRPSAIDARCSAPWPSLRVLDGSSSGSLASGERVRSPMQRLVRTARGPRPVRVT